jgi:hypothetical protein
MVMKRLYKVRFNLGKGKNYMKWKVEGPDGVGHYAISYYNPDEVQIVMHGCQLKNQKRTAEKILAGAHKTVCAWIKCEAVDIQQPNTTPCDDFIHLNYNPRVLPHWFINNGENADGMVMEQIVSVGRKLVGKSK